MEAPVVPQHATDIVSLVFGTIFAGFTVVWLLVVTDLIGWDDARVAGPVTLIAAGAVGLVAALRPHRENDDDPNASADPSLGP